MVARSSAVRRSRTVAGNSRRCPGVVNDNVRRRDTAHQAGASAVAE